MSKHGEDQSRICPWCFRTFFDRRVVDQHAIRKHPHSFSRTEEVVQRGKLQAYHQRKRATQALSSEGSGGSERILAERLGIPRRGNGLQRK